MTPQQNAVATRRAEVARLTTDGLSQRAIAERLGISRDTVVRDQRTNQTTATAPERTSQTTSQTTATAPERTSPGEERTSGAPGADPGAHHPHQPVLVLELDADLDADLAALVPDGSTPQEVVRTVLHDVAATYRTAVRTGRLPAGPFVIESMTLRPVAAPRPPL